MKVYESKINFRDSYLFILNDVKNIEFSIEIEKNLKSIEIIYGGFNIVTNEIKSIVLKENEDILGNCFLFENESLSFSVSLDDDDFNDFIEHSFIMNNLRYENIDRYRIIEES